MASILLKNIPPRLHARLKKQAALNGRSMNQEAQLLLESNLTRSAVRGTRRVRPFHPVKMRDPKTGKPIPLTIDMIEEAIREGRE